MTSFDDLIPLLMTLAGFISAAVWATAVREFTQGRLPLQQCEPRPVRWDHWTILAALGIWVLVDTAVVSLLGLDSESGPLTRIQVGTYSGLGKCALLIPLWLYAAGAKPRDLLPLARPMGRRLQSGPVGFVRQPAPRVDREPTDRAAPHSEQRPPPHPHAAGRSFGTNNCLDHARRIGRRTAVRGTAVSRDPTRLVARPRPPVHSNRLGRHRLRRHPRQLLARPTAVDPTLVDPRLRLLPPPQLSGQRTDARAV